MSFDPAVLILSSVLVLAIVGTYLFLCVRLWKTYTGRQALLLLAFCAIGAGSVWAFLGIGVGLFLSFCSGCFSPGTSTRNAFSVTLGLPLLDSALPFGELNYPVVAGGLYILGLVAAPIIRTRVQAAARR
jgi:fucose permease